MSVEVEDVMVKGKTARVVVHLSSDGSGRMRVETPTGRAVYRVARGAHRDVVRRARRCGVQHLVTREFDDALVRYEFYGSPALVEEHAAELTKAWPPAGYGTRIVSSRELANGNGLLMVVTRLRSCD